MSGAKAGPVSTHERILTILGATDGDNRLRAIPSLLERTFDAREWNA